MAFVSPPPGSVFGDHRNVVPGEVLVKLADTVAPPVSIPSGPLHSLSADLPTSFGLPPLDRACRGLGVRAVSCVHAPVPPRMTRPEALALRGAYRLRLDPGRDVEEAVAQLSAVGEVEIAEPNRYRQTYTTPIPTSPVPVPAPVPAPNDPRFDEQWGLRAVRCVEAWARTLGEPSVAVAVIDTGVDLDHPDLAPQLVAGRDLVDMPGATAPPGFRFEGDFAGRDPIPQDEVGHGTHVAGTVGAVTGNDVGVAGVAPGCTLMPVRVLPRIVAEDDPDVVRAVGSATDVAAGIRWAADRRARVINLSLGSAASTFVERDAIAYALARDVVVVAAMGNEATEDPSYPAAYEGVVAVAALTRELEVAPFSNSGPHCDLAAPGVDILSTDWDDGYSALSGTSMATPHAAGAAALVRSAVPGLTAPQVREVLQASARPLDAGDPLPSPRYGYGLVDAAAAVERAVCRTGPLDRDGGI